MMHDPMIWLRAFVQSAEMIAGLHVHSEHTGGPDGVEDVSERFVKVRGSGGGAM